MHNVEPSFQTLYDCVLTCYHLKFNSSQPVFANKGLVTNYGEGGLQNGRGGGDVKFYPYEKGGQKKF